MMYRDFAEIYDTLMTEFDYDKAGNFVDHFASEAKIEKVLEIGCGTGNFTQRLLHFKEITAFDLSDEMLSIAYNKIKNDNVKFRKQDMRDFNFMEKFDMAVAVCDGINYVLEESEILGIFKRVYSHLEDEGLFIFDLNTEEQFQGFEGSYIDEVEDVFYVWENFYDKVDKINLYSINFFVREGDYYRRFYEEHYEKFYENQFIIKTLKEVGFKEIKTFNGYEFEENIEHAKRIVYVAKK
ncbi:MAG: class I SAM-dependent methyltransferase [Peptoniphilus sp.]|nr:class I SAM-dependent methyltransferase [Peptoniphilus sp.]